jgi:hypothetical protein
MGLEELYKRWVFKNGNKLGATNTPREQSEGKVAVDFLPNTYQTEIRNRTPDDKVVTQATADDDTTGMFNKTTAFQYYSTIFNSPLKRFKSRVVHLYNAQGTTEEKYITSTKVKNTPGALYINNP